MAAGEGNVVMAVGRHEWDCLMSGTRCDCILIGVAQDGGISDYNQSMSLDSNPDAYLVYSCTHDFAYDHLTGGPKTIMRGELGTVTKGESAGVILDFDEDYLQFTRNGAPVGRRVSGIRGKRLRACAHFYCKGEAVTLENYRVSGGGAGGV